MVTVWMSPAGSDSNDGLSQSSPVPTLGRVQDILRGMQPTTDVQVRIDQGVYVAGETVWDFYIPYRSISFLPVGYEIGGTIGERPVFRSDGTTGYWFAAKVPDEHTGPALVSRLRFYCLRVERYGKGGLLFYGRAGVVEGFRVPTVGLNGNAVYGMEFTELGSVWGNGIGYAGVGLVNSSGNDINSSRFLHLENSPPSGGAIHGMYAQDGSSNNLVRNSLFQAISGNPIRTRNRCNDNEIRTSTFDGAGDAGYGEWFCDQACAEANPAAGLECPSVGNVFHDNALLGGYDGEPLAEWWLSPQGLDNPGPSGCPPSGPRLTTYGNTVEA